MDLALSHPLAFVPTMGALHAGHQSLIELARTKSTNVLVSIFVNPLQFENPDDLAKYPRDIEGDRRKAESAGATLIWNPTVEEIYPKDPTIIPSGELGNKFEGVHRFGHFDGVLTVVKRLFEIAQPEIAVFGEKDFQQLFLIKRMVKEFNLPINILSAPIVREPDGLAMSSRNVRLDFDARAASRIISEALSAAAGEKSLSKARAKLHKVLAGEERFALDYAEIIDEESFEIAEEGCTKPRALVAGWISGVRLIDNMALAARS